MVIAIYKKTDIKSSMNFIIILSIALLIFYLFCIIFFRNKIESFDIKILNNAYLNQQSKYQIFLLLTACVSIFTTYLLNKENFFKFFSFGDINAITEKSILLGINGTEGWIQVGLTSLFFISIVTSVFMFFQLKKAKIRWYFSLTAFLFVILFSLTNSLGEEIITRLGVISPLSGVISPLYIFVISAIIFGLAHYRGMPNGIVGILLASYLGFVMSKALYETGGLFWPWAIHFIQDVIIIYSLYLINNKNRNLSKLEKQID